MDGTMACDEKKCQSVVVSDHIPAVIHCSNLEINDLLIEEQNKCKNYIPTAGFGIVTFRVIAPS